MWRENKTKHRARIRSTNRGFVKKNVVGFWYKPRGDWFSFAKLRKLCFPCSCKQTHETSISQRHARCAYVLRHPPERLPRTTATGSERKVFITFEIWIFFLQKLMDLLQEAFIHVPEPCEACFILDACALFDILWTVEKKHPPTAMITLGRNGTIFNITPIGFVWKKKVLYT